MKLNISEIKHSRGNLREALFVKVTPENQCDCCKSKGVWAEWTVDAIEQEKLAEIFESLACNIRKLKFNPAGDHELKED